MRVSTPFEASHSSITVADTGRAVEVPVVPYLRMKVEEVGEGLGRTGKAIYE